MKKLEEAIKELNHLKYTVIERDYEMQNLHDLSYSRHYEQLQEELNAQIFTQKNLLIKKKKKKQRLEVTNVLLRQETVDCPEDQRTT